MFKYLSLVCSKAILHHLLIHTVILNCYHIPLPSLPLPARLCRYSHTDAQKVVICNGDPLRL
jgi:hypothetical protein